MQNTLALAGMLLALAVVLYLFLDPRSRALIGFAYQSLMRWITSLFVEVDPIGILKGYVEHLEDNLQRMKRQINKLRGQMHKVQELIHKNRKAIESNLELASKAKAQENKAQMILRSRKAGRLRESNMRLEDLLKKMEVLYRVLRKMYENSEILLEDVRDQVMIKEQERKAILSSHSAMKSAMNIIRGDKDRKANFDRALEAMAQDVGQKVGEMERFMEVSSSFMESLDLQNGVFEEEGLKMLEQWEKEGVSRILGEEKDQLLLQADSDEEVLDLSQPLKKPVRQADRRNQYDSLFEE